MKKLVSKPNNDGVIICKNVHKEHDIGREFPTLGPDTLKGIQKGEVAAIAWNSRKTLILNKDEFVKRAKELDITLVSVDYSYKVSCCCSKRINKRGLNTQGVI